MPGSSKPVNELNEVEALAEIERLRRLCLVHRYLYYVLHDPLIEDTRYDQFERRLREVVGNFPQIAAETDGYWCCPTRTVGSESSNSYPEGIAKLAESLKKYARGEKFDDTPSKTRVRRSKTRITADHN